MLTIRVICAAESLRLATRVAVSSLNAIQRVFYYYICDDDHLAAAQLDGKPVLSQDAFQLVSTMQEAGNLDSGYILVLTNRLVTTSYSNAFGSFDGDRRTAVFTCYGLEGIVADTVRFLRYYLVRYTFSFACPLLKTHKDTRDCFFDRKELKTDIWRSLRSGGLCEEHWRALRSATSPTVIAALEKLGKRVAEEIPYSLVMKGGGAKGLALVGAVKELYQLYKFDTFAGTSAGAIAAVLLGAGFTPEELEVKLRKMNFDELRDRGLLRVLMNLVRFKAISSGAHLQRWIDDAIREKATSNLNSTTLADLAPNRVLVYAASRNGLEVFDSAGRNRDTDAAFATLCSASIPFFFRSPSHGDLRLFDGGVKANFPLYEFLEENKEKPVVGLCLLNVRRNSQWLVADVLESLLSGQEQRALREFADRIVVIDPTPINTLDFRLTNIEKEYLLSCGRLAAMKYLTQFRPDSAPSGMELLKAEQEHQTLRSQVERVRATRKVEKRLVISLLTISAVLSFWWYKSHEWLPLAGALASISIILLVKRLYKRSYLSFCSMY